MMMILKVMIKVAIIDEGVVMMMVVVMMGE